MGNILALVTAFFMDWIVGDPYWFPHPVRFIGKYIKFYEGLFYNKDGNQRVRGLFLVITLILITGSLTYGFMFTANLIHPIVGFIVKVCIMWTCLAHKCLGQEAKKVYMHLKGNNLVGARRQVGYLVARQTENLTEEQVSQAVIETVVENTSDGIIAPMFYMVIGGPALGMIYKAINTMDSMVGYKNDKYLDYGRCGARLDDIANYIPARITGLLMVIAAYLAGLDGKASFNILRRDRNNHSSPNAGYPEAATAGALSIQLGGGHVYFGKLVEKPTIGDDIKPIRKEHIRGSRVLMTLSSLLFLGSVLILNIALHGFL